MNTLLLKSACHSLYSLQCVMCDASCILSVQHESFQDAVYNKSVYSAFSYKDHCILTHEEAI